MSGLEVENMSGMWAADIAEDMSVKKEITFIKHKPVYEFISRFFDIFLTLISLVIALPIFLIAAIAIKLEDGGAVLYKQVRTGKNGQVFVIYKMRSMCVMGKETEFSETCVNDPRITKVGKFIRRTRIDEIPQLYNIFVGNMKIIGPRPLVPEQIDEILEYLPEFVNRLAVKPGLTGLAQVSGGNDLTPEEKLFLDVEYIENRGLIMDLKIVFKTVMTLFSGDGAR